MISTGREPDGCKTEKGACSDGHGGENIRLMRPAATKLTIHGRHFFAPGHILKGSR